MKNKLKKILGLVLSVALIGTSVDVSAFTVRAKENTATIVAFEELAADVREQTVYEGQTEEAICFPSTLNVTVEKTVTVQSEVIKTVPVEKVVQIENVADSVSGSDLSVSGNDVVVESQTIVTETQVTELMEETKRIEENASLEVVSWKIDAATSTSDSFIADNSALGYVYTYVPELKMVDSEGNTFVIAEDIVLPKIRVQIAPAVNMAGQASFTVNYYVEADPSDSRAIAFTNPNNSAEIKYFLHMEQLKVNYTEGKVVRGTCVVANGAQLVNDVATSTGISSTMRNYDYAEIAHDYNNVTGTQVRGGEGTVTADGSLTFNFFWKTASYSENYYVDAETDTYASGLVSINGKYYKLFKSNEVKVTASNANTTVSITDLSGTEEFEAYQLVTPQPSGYAASGTVDSLGNLALYQFYDKKATTSYTEQYFVEDETATENYITVLVGSELITYRLHHENIVENAYVDSTATIEDLSGDPAFSGYTLVDRTGQGYYPSRTVQDGNRTYVYQFYDKNQTCNYTVSYYVEVYEHQKDGSNIVVNVNGTDKYYNRIPDSAYNMACQAPEGTVITVADSSSDIPGVYAGGVKVSDTFKAYTSTLRKYSYDTTVAYGKHTGTVAADGSLQIVLFYDWIDTTPTTAKYTEKYYAELADQGVDYGYELIDDSGVKYELLGEYEKTGTIGEEVTISDISTQEPYKTDYELMEATDEHPSTASVTSDNGTVVYQIYRLHPQYMITYYKESESGGYTMDSYLIKRMPNGTTISYLEPEDGAAAAAVGTTAIDGTTKSYEGYEFNEDVTVEKGKSSFTVTRGGDNVIELYFDKIVPTATYTEEYYLELYDQNATSWDALVDGIKYELKESNMMTAELDAPVSITDLSTTTYSSYVLMPTSSQYPSQVDNVSDGTKLYQFYRRMPFFAIWYYLEVEEGESGTIIQEGERFFKKMSPGYGSGTSKGMYFDVTENPDGTAAVWRILNGVSTEYETRFNRDYLPEGYVFDAEMTYSRKQYPYLMELDKDSTIEVFYKKVPSTVNYTEQYYVELKDQNAAFYDKDVDGVKYKLQESNVKTIEKGLGASITNKSTQAPYTGYVLQPATDALPSEVTAVADDNGTILYQFYRLQHDYAVYYYKETTSDTAGAVVVGDKHYELAETVNGRNYAGTQITSVQRQDGTVGVTENSTEKSDSFKSYANYVFNAEATNQNHKASVTVSGSGENVVELFFDKARTASYRGEYYVELEDQNATDYDKLINGIKYELNESYTVAGVAYDARVEIADKSSEYAALGYELMEETSEYPSWISDVDDTGTTILYQIYRRLPKYTVYYYTEAEKETVGTIQIGGKYYVRQENDTFIKTPASGTIITYAATGSGEAGVAEDGVGLAASLKSYDGFVFSEAATIANGKNAGTIASGNPVVIELFFDMIRADYKEYYWVEAPDATSDYVEIQIGDELKKFVIAGTNIVEDVWIKSKVVIADKSEQFVSYELVYEEIPGYSSVAYGVNGDGTTILHQLYVLKRTAPYVPNDPTDQNIPTPVQTNSVQATRTEDGLMKLGVAAKTDDKANVLWAVLLSGLGCIMLAMGKLLRKKQ